MSRALKITLTTDRHGHPLATIDFPGLDVAMYAPQLRTMAGQLLRAADDLDRQSGVATGAEDALFDALLALDRIEGLAAMTFMTFTNSGESIITSKQVESVVDCFMSEVRHARVLIESAKS